MVSATPYNILSKDTQILVENEVKWLPDAEGDAYYGMEKFDSMSNRLDTDF